MALKWSAVCFGPVAIRMEYVKDEDVMYCLKS